MFKSCFFCQLPRSDLGSRLALENADLSGPATILRRVVTKCTGYVQDFRTIGKYYFVLGKPTLKIGMHLAPLRY